MRITPYRRLLSAPERSFFLFGPRGTGKTSWLQLELPAPESAWIDLLKPSTLMAYQREPELLEKIASASSSQRWIVIDEVQRLPNLDVVQGLISKDKNISSFDRI